MTGFVKLAWRNIWRNRRRTILTIVAVTFGTFLIIVQRGMQTGTYDRMIETTVRRSEGHIQIHAKGYWDKKTLRYAFPVADVDTAALSALPHVQEISVKLAIDALVGAGEENTTGARVVGVIPSLEAAMTFFGSGRMVDGRFLTDADTTGAVIGRTMAQNLRAGVGDELVIFTQGRDGSMAAAVLHIVGVFRAGEPDMDGYTVITHLSQLQRTLVAEGRATAIAMTVDDAHSVPEVIGSIKTLLDGENVDEQWEVMGYDELLPALMQSIAFDNASGIIFLLLLLVIIAFGILNTILMSVMERFHELGVMMAVGMKAKSIAAMIFLEGAFLNVIGLAIGNVAGYLLNWWWHIHPLRLDSYEETYESLGFEPILTSVTSIPEQALWSAVMFGMALLVALWPVWTATHFRPVDAIRHV